MNQYTDPELKEYSLPNDLFSNFVVVFLLVLSLTGFLFFLTIFALGFWKLIELLN